MRNHPLLLISPSDALARVLKSADYCVLRAHDPSEIARLCKQGFPLPAVLLDLDAQETSGGEPELALIRAVHAFLPEANIVCVAQHAETRRVVDAMRAGATNFIMRDRLLTDLDHALGPEAAPRDQRQSGCGFGLSPNGPDLDSLVETSRPILIVGEPATGKVRLSRVIHERSSRRHLPWVRIDCESLRGEPGYREIAGYKRGAFVGAFQDHRGLLVAAGAGTVVLEGLDSMDPALQKLLARALVSRTVAPLGSDPVSFEANVIATSQWSIEVLRTQGIMSDLLHCFSGNVVQVRPLRARRDEIVTVARDLLAEAIGPRHTALLDQDLASALRDYSWPGNLREMLQIVQALAETRNSRYVAELLRRKGATRVRTAAGVS